MANYVTDARARRVRGVRSSTGKYKALNDRDIEILKLLVRIPYLSSDWIWTLLPGEKRGRSKARFLDALTHLFHETNTPDGAAYLDWPQQQRRNHVFRATASIYAISNAGRRALRRHGLQTESDLVIPSALGPFPHAMMVCETLASLLYGTLRDARLDFISMKEMLKQDEIRKPILPVALSWRFTKAGPLHRYRLALEPDFVFGIEHLTETGKVYRFYAGECEHTNTVRARTLKRNSYFRKVLGYKTVFANKSYKALWGIPNLRLLTLSPSVDRMDLMKNVVLQVATHSKSHDFLFQELSVFGERFKGPSIDQSCIEQPWFLPDDKNIDIRSLV